MGVNASPLTWVTRLLWLSLPLTAGDLLSDALAERSGSVRLTVVVVAWALWAAGLLASLVTTPLGLTAMRVLAPLPLLAGIVAALDVTPSALGWLGLAIGALLTVLPLSAEVGDDFINGASYGDERRFGLRPPGAMLLGPLPLIWSLTTVPTLIGVLLLAARQWILGAVLVVVGLALAWWGSRVLYRLALRCVVFVPAGVTLVDDLTLADPVLFRRSDVVRIGPAPVEHAAHDLSASATGLILQIEIDPQVSIVPAVARGATTEAIPARSVLIAASRPGALLEHAATRQLAVQRN